MRTARLLGLILLLVMSTFTCAQKEDKGTVLSPLGGAGNGLASIHLASTDNTKGSCTYLTDAFVPKDAIWCVTPFDDSTQKGTVHNPHPTGILLEGARVAICNLDGADMPVGAAFSVEIYREGPASFRHEASTDNIKNNWTVLDSPACNANPEAPLYITQIVTDLDEIKSGAHLTGAWYTDERWAIYNEDQKDMQPGMRFDVIVAPGILHIASVATIKGDSTFIDDPALNNQPSAIVQATHIYNPSGMGGTYLRTALGVRYVDNRWSVYTQDHSEMPPGTAFVLRSAGQRQEQGASSPLIDAAALRNHPLNLSPLEDMLHDTILVRPDDIRSDPNISHTAEASTNPRIAADEEAIYVVWTEALPTGNTEIFFARRDKLASRFAPAINLSANAGVSMDPQLIVTGEQVVVAWSDNSTGRFVIMTARSEASGEHFSPPVNLSNSTGQCTWPRLAANGQTVHAVWVDRPLPSAGQPRIQFKTIGSPEPPRAVGNGQNDVQRPVLFTSGAIIILSWEQVHRGGDWDPFIASSLDAGRTWRWLYTDVNVTIYGNYGDQGNILTIGRAPYVGVLYENRVYGCHMISTAESMDEGASLGVTRGSSPSIGDSLGIADPTNTDGRLDGHSRMPAAFAQQTGWGYFATWRQQNFLCYEKRGYAPLVMATPQRDPANMCLVGSLDDRTQLIVFDERQGTTPEPRDILVMQVVDGHPGPLANLSNNAGNSIRPQLAYNSDSIYIVWMDNTTGNSEIFFRSFAR